MPDKPDSYRTLASAATAAQTMDRSVFLATAAPIADDDEARTLVADMQHRHRDARHVCFAWRLGYDECLRELRHDAGEPPRTAGEPILRAIRGAGLTDAAVIVVRHFGGVKLGTGGLMKAYGGVAAEALAAAPRRTVRLGRRGHLDFAYSQHDTIARLLAEHGGSVEQEDYAALVRWRVWLPLSTWGSFIRAVREATAGRVDPTTEDEGPAAR